MAEKRPESERDGEKEGGREEEGGGAERERENKLLFCSLPPV